MDGRAEPTALTAQRAAIQEVRTRYERGELPYDAFRRALDALVLARDPGDCQAILDAIPVSPLSALAALDAPPLAPAPVNAAPPTYQRIVAFLSQIKKLRRPWRLADSTDAVAFMGEIKLDLRHAELPGRAHMRITAIMGTATIYIPRSVQVAVHTTVMLGDTHALGESVTGVIAFGHEEHTPASAATAARLEIEVFTILGNVQIVLTDERAAVFVSELVRDALRAIAVGAQRGLRPGASEYPSLSAGPERDRGRSGGR